MPLERAQTCHPNNRAFQGKRARKRPSRPSVSRLNDEKKSKRPRPDDDFTIRDAGSATINGRDPRRQSKTAGRRENFSSDTRQVSAWESEPVYSLTTPPVSTESEVASVKQGQSAPRGPNNGYPLSPRSKSPESDETRRREDERGKEESAFAQRRAPSLLYSRSFESPSTAKSTPTSPVHDSSRRRDLTINTSLPPRDFYDPYSPRRMSTNERRKSAASLDPRRRNFSAQLAASPSTSMSPGTIPSSPTMSQGLDEVINLTEKAVEHGQMFKDAEIKFKTYQRSSSRFERHSTGFQSVASVVNDRSKVLQSTKDEAQNQHAKTNECKKRAIGTLVKLLDKKAASSNPTDVVTKADLAELQAQLATKDEFDAVKAENTNLKKELTDTQSWLQNLQILADSVKESALTQAILDQSSYVKQHELCQTVTQLKMRDSVHEAKIRLVEHQLEDIVSDLVKVQEALASQERSQPAAVSAVQFSPDQQVEIAIIAEKIVDEEKKVLEDYLKATTKFLTDDATQSSCELKQLKTRVSAVSTFQVALEKRMNTISSDQLAQHIAQHVANLQSGAVGDLRRRLANVYSSVQQLWLQVNARGQRPAVPSPLGNLGRGA